MINITEKKFLAAPKKVINQMQLSNEIVNIVSDKKGYVIIDADEWRNIYETIYLNNIKGLSKSIIKSSKEPLDSSTPLNKVDW
ncbi:MAG: hypothetical protein FVQ77_09655 [Cytophagales bacterium]|nr:hypothetical protein [Cytophagales bacterium]